MRIGHFGGSFDPPHRGHLAVAQAATQAFRLDEVLFVPTAQQPLKPSGADASYADRFAMVQRLCAGYPAFSASDLEAPVPGTPNYTIDTLHQLAALHPDGQLFVLVGADAFLTLPQWRDPAKLLRAADWIVVSRPGYPLVENLASMSLSSTELGRVHPLEGIADSASATQIRLLLRSPQRDTPEVQAELKQLLPSGVLAYIYNRGIYL